MEYEALNEDFHTRGARCEEQIEVLRALWTQEVVTFEGRWHKITAAGLNPLPVQRPIPIWIGGFADVVLKRVARIGDGWYPMFPPDDNARETLARLRQYTRDAGRDPSEIGIEARVSMNWGAPAGGRLAAGVRLPEACAEEAVQWGEIGGTHVTLNTMDAGLETPDDHLDAMRRFKAALDR